MLQTEHSQQQQSTTSKASEPTTSMLHHIQNVYDALSGISVATLIEYKRSRSVGQSLHLISVHEDTPLRDVLRVMADKNIMAVAVHVDQGEATGGKKYTGIVSIYDVLAWTVFQKLFDDLEALDTDAQVGTTVKRFQDLDTEADAYFSTPVSTLVGYTAESSCSWTLHSTEPLTSLLQLITTPPYHRILVVDVDQAARNVSFDDEDVPHNGESCIVMVTQSDVLQFIQEYRDTISPASMMHLFNTTVAQVEEYAIKNLRSLRNMDLDPNQLSTQTNAGERAHRVITVPSTNSAINAFRVMYIHRVSAVAIVSPVDGSIVANLSATDLRGMTADMACLETLLLPVFEFLESKSRTRGKEQVKPDQLRCVEKSRTLEEVVSILGKDKIHRVWVQEEGDVEKPVGVLTVGDILSFFIPVGKNLQAE